MKNKITSSRLNDALKNANMSPAELSRRTGIGKSSISQYLSGIFVPKQDKAYSMANELNVSPSWLMGITDSMNPKKNPQKIIEDLDLASWMGDIIFSESESLYKLLKTISVLEEDQIKALFVMAEALKK